MKDFPDAGARYARVIYRSNNRKLKEPPQNERVNRALLRAQHSAGEYPASSRPVLEVIDKAHEACR